MQLSHHLWHQTPLPLSEAKKIILLHGMGGTGALWRPLAAALEDQMAVLSPDQRGHGKSRLPHVPGSREKIGYTPFDYGQDVIETMGAIPDSSSPFRPAWILGHSMGVRTAVAVAHLKPEWVEGLILIDLGFSGVAGGGLGENLGAFIRVLPDVFPSREAARAFMQENCPDPSIAQYLMAVSVRTESGEMTFPFDHSALIQTIHAARDISVRHWVEEFAERGKPVLILRGAQSLVWSAEEFRTEQKHFSRFPSVTFTEIENAGHGLPFEQRQVLVQLIREKMGL